MKYLTGRNDGVRREVIWIGEPHEISDPNAAKGHQRASLLVGVIILHPNGQTQRVNVPRQNIRDVNLNGKLGSLFGNAANP